MEARKTGQLIMERRKALSMTQKELAEKLMVSPKTVSKWECGNGCPDVGILLGLSEILQISVTALLTGEMEPQTLPEKEEKEGATMEVWRAYGIREKMKTALFYLVLAALFCVCLAGFLRALMLEVGGTAIFAAVCCVAVGAVICLKLGGFRFCDWRKQEVVTTEAIVLEKKIRTAGGGSATGYPCIVVRMTGDRKKALDTVSWDAYDALFPGDEIRVRYQGFVLVQYELLRPGVVSRQEKESKESDAVFKKCYTKTLARWHHFKVAEFVLADGKTLTVRVPENWEASGAEVAGTLRWHGEWLEEFQG